MLLLGLNFRCDQIYKYERYDLGHTVVLLKSDFPPLYPPFEFEFVCVSGNFLNCTELFLKGHVNWPKEE
jgi:hypothetical protein